MKIPYLDSTGLENQKWLAGPEIQCLAGWKADGLMRDGMVNRPSLELSGLIGVRVIVPHTTSRENKAYGKDD